MRVADAPAARPPRRSGEPHSGDLPTGDGVAQAAPRWRTTSSPTAATASSATAPTATSTSAKAPDATAIASSGPPQQTSFSPTRAPSPFISDPIANLARSSLYNIVKDFYSHVVV
ncbi:MAG: hypothetical protein M3P50_03975 [Actinomycetota bacterium]|nr:hypothetical protein [Actinomycetota bacterium]